MTLSAPNRIGALHRRLDRHDHFLVIRSIDHGIVRLWLLVVALAMGALLPVILLIANLTRIQQQPPARLSN
jgi:hypothetical protein